MSQEENGVSQSWSTVEEREWMFVEAGRQQFMLSLEFYIFYMFDI